MSSNQGIQFLNDGGCYEGEYKDGKYHGQGIFISFDGDKYEGEFKDGKRHGQGTHTWSDGDKYVGKFKDGKKHGQGTYTTRYGGKVVGEWKVDLPLNVTRYDKKGNILYKIVNGVKKVFTDEPVVQKIEKDKTKEMFVTVGQSGFIFTSSDGNSWTKKRTSGTSEDLYEVTYGNSTFVTVGENGIILTSPDEFFWTERTSGTSVDLFGVAYSQ